MRQEEIFRLSLSIHREEIIAEHAWEGAAFEFISHNEGEKFMIIFRGIEWTSKRILSNTSRQQGVIGESEWLHLLITNDIRMTVDMFEEGIRNFIGSSPKLLKYLLVVHNPRLAANSLERDKSFWLLV